MYQNCAAVTITDGGSGLSGPPPFVANINVNQCETKPNMNVVFPDPGPVVEYGGALRKSRPTTPAGFDGENCVGPGATASVVKAKVTIEEPSKAATPPDHQETKSSEIATPTETSPGIPSAETSPLTTDSTKSLKQKVSRQR